MKKSYIVPLCETIEMHIEAHMLTGSKEFELNEGATFKNESEVLSNKKDSHPIWGE